MAYENIQFTGDEDWKDRIVNIGYPGLKNLPKIVERLLKDDNFKTLRMIVPDLECEEWFQQLEKKVEGTSWHGVEPEDGIQFWLDEAGRPVRDEPLTWWIIKIQGK